MLAAFVFTTDDYSDSTPLADVNHRVVVADAQCRMGYDYGNRSGRFVVQKTVTLLLLLAGWIGGIGTPMASTMLEVERDGDAYALYAEMEVAAPVSEVYSLLSDYDRLEELNDVIKEVELIDSPSPNHHRTRSISETCILVFCGRVVQMQDVYETPDREILAVTIPEQSNLEEGVIHWSLRPTGEGTHLRVYVRVIPDFWVPPLIGPWAVKRALSEQVRQTAQNIEKLASG